MTLLAAHAAPAASRGPGRPRDAELDGRLIAATLHLIDTEKEVTVSRVLASSGVSRAGLYRRWPSLTALVAAALDVGRTVPPELPVGEDPLESILAMMAEDPLSVIPGMYSEARFRQRIRLVMSDRELQHIYWEEHVRHRRAPIERALAAASSRGELAADLDPVAAFDAIAGVAYYQIVVRGESLSDPETHERVTAALKLVWRGMRATH